MMKRHPSHGKRMRGRRQGIAETGGGPDLENVSTGLNNPENDERQTCILGDEMNHIVEDVLCRRIA
jgi:hypothetical protein